MTKSTYQINKIQVIIIGVMWFGLGFLFYTGLVPMTLVGHVEVCMVVAFAIILLGLHLFSVIKSSVYKTLQL